MIIYKRASTLKELEQILLLQKTNLPENLSDIEKTEQGFVTVKHTLEILKKMNDVCPHTIAIHNNKVIGYALSMTKDFAEDITVLKPMFLEINSLIIDIAYIVMGQICIDKKFRKQGVFRDLYSFMKEQVAKKHQLIITEIDFKNKRSLVAHEKIGFKKLNTYVANNQKWVIVSLKV